MKPNESDYKVEISALVEDLGLTAKINLDICPRQFIRANRKGLQTGEVIPHRGTYSVTVAVGGRSRVDVLASAAHELRHVWQTESGTWTWDFYKEKGRIILWRAVWNGSDFVPTPKVWLRPTWRATGLPTTPEWDEPHEIDARAYSKHALERLFGLKYGADENPTERAQAAFLGAIKK